jgi:hypothetical protein
MRFQDLVFNEIEGALPQLHCNQCGARPVTLAAEIPLPGQDGAKGLITLCSRDCESYLKGHPMADEFLADVIGVSFWCVGYCWRIQSQPRKLCIFSRVRRISSLFGGFANSIAPVR